MLRPLVLLTALVASMGACSGPLGRVTMNLDPNTQSIVRVEGSRPEVRIVNYGPVVPTLLVESAAAERDGTWTSELAPSGGTYLAELPGPVRFTVTNTAPEPTLIEIKAVRYKRIVIERSPFPLPEEAP